MTTAKTLSAVREGIRQSPLHPHEINFTPFVATLVHRSSVYDIEGSPVLYLVHYDIGAWKREECPLCAQGSKRIEEPKKNWAALTGTAV